MDRLEEIRQRTEAGGPIRRIDMKYLLSEVDRLAALHKREIIVTGEYAQRVIDSTARAEAAEAERDAAVEAIEKVGTDFCNTVGCYCCAHRKGCLDGADGPFEYDPKWRGPQEAGEAGIARV